MSCCKQKESLNPYTQKVIRIFFSLLNPFLEKWTEKNRRTEKNDLKSF